MFLWGMLQAGDGQVLDQGKILLPCPLVFLGASSGQKSYMVEAWGGTWHRHPTLSGSDSGHLATALQLHLASVNIIALWKLQRWLDSVGGAVHHIW